MPRTEKQKIAACADYGRSKAGKKPKTFKGMSRNKLKDWCTSPVQKESVLIDKIELRLLKEADIEHLPPGVKRMNPAAPGPISTKGITKWEKGADQFQVSGMRHGEKVIDYDEDLPYELEYVDENGDKQTSRFEAGTPLTELKQALEKYPGSRLYKLNPQGDFVHRQNALVARNIRPLIAKREGDLETIGEFEPKSPETGGSVLKKWERGEGYKAPKASGPKKEKEYTGWDEEKWHKVTWTNSDGTKEEKMFKPGTKEKRVNMFVDSIKKLGGEAKIKEVKSLSELNPINALRYPDESPKVTELKAQRDDERERKKDPTTASKEKPMVMSHTQYQELIDSGQFDPAFLDKLVQRGTIRLSGRV